MKKKKKIIITVYEIPFFLRKNDFYCENFSTNKFYFHFVYRLFKDVKMVYVGGFSMKYENTYSVTHIFLFIFFYIYIRKFFIILCTWKLEILLYKYK